LDLYGMEGLDKQKHNGNQPTDMFGNPIGTRKGPDANGDIKVTLNELYIGTTKEMKIERNILCPRCRGTGSKDGKLKMCKKCKGRG